MVIAAKSALSLALGHRGWETIVQLRIVTASLHLRASVYLRELLRAPGGNFSFRKGDPMGKHKSPGEGVRVSAVRGRYSERSSWEMFL